MNTIAQTTKLNRFISVYQIKVQFHLNSRLRVGLPTSNGCDKENSKPAKENLVSNKTNSSNLDVKLMKDYYRNKLENSPSLVFLRKQYINCYQACESILKRGQYRGDKKISSQVLQNKLHEYYHKFEKITGFYNIRIAQQETINAQDRLAEAQDRRRELLNELTTIQTELQKIQSNLWHCDRIDSLHLVLVKQEIDKTREEREKLERIKIANTEERERFTYLTLAIKTSHEQERAQARKIKYFTVIGTLIASFIGLSANNFFGNKQIEEVKKEIQKWKVEPVAPVESWVQYFTRKTKASYHYFVPPNK